MIFLLLPARGPRGVIHAEGYAGFEAVAHLRSAFDLSARRACKIVDCVRAISLAPVGRAELRVHLLALAHERRRFGYRRLPVLLRRKGFIVNHKRLFRLYREVRGYDSSLYFRMPS